MDNLFNNFELKMATPMIWTPATCSTPAKEGGERGGRGEGFRKLPLIKIIIVVI